MTIQQFIEKAVAGGWKPQGYNFSNDALSYKVQAVSKIKFKERIFLDPLAWQAVGKVEGWKGKYGWCENCGEKGRDLWLLRQHSMIDALAEGKTIEQYLETL